MASTLAVLLAVVSAAAPTGEGDQAVRIDALLSGIEVRPPINHENLAVFPLTAQGPGIGGFQPLAEAIREGLVEVVEKEGGVVNTVRVRNAGGRRVFGLAGEIVTGAKQNRMLQRDVVLPPKSGWIDLPVFCVEHGRWSDATREFGSKGQIGSAALRGRANQTACQSAVWAEVSRSNAGLGIETGTERYDAVFEDADVQHKVAEYRRGLERRLPSLAGDALGVAVAVGGRIVCIDVFGSRPLFQVLWPRLLESYVIDALGERPSGSVSVSEVEALLVAGRVARLTEQPGIGGGRGYQIDGSGVSGSMLALDGRLVHVDLFPRGTTPSDVPRLDIRRRDTNR